MGATGVIIGRFQDVDIQPELREAIKRLEEKHGSLVIVMGVHKTGATRRNPLDAGSRKASILGVFPRISIYTLDDHPSDAEWSSKLDELIEQQIKDNQVVLYGSKDGFVDRYSGKFRAVAMGTSASLLKPGVKPESSDFRRGVVFGLQDTFPKIYPTVDIAVFRKERSEILLGMKSSAKKWRFPGGFTDPGDRDFEAAARRELHEECGISEISVLTYEGSFKIDDWRYRFEDDKIITTFFSADLISGQASASDDLAEVEWFPLDKVKELVKKGEIAPEHLPLFDHLLEKYHRGI